MHESGTCGKAQADNNVKQSHSTVLSRDVRQREASCTRITKGVEYAGLHWNPSDGDVRKGKTQVGIALTRSSSQIVRESKVKV